MKQDDINVLRGRKLSLEGATQIGTGAMCKVYLLPDDNVVKVLNDNDFASAEREILLSKWAFKKGLATAISYDVVSVDGHPGLLYESLGRDNLRNHLRDNEDDLQPLLERYLEFIKSINSIEVEEGQLPSAKEKALLEIRSLKEVLTPKEYERILKLVDTIPENSHMIHGDCHMKNIKMIGEKLFLIDLDTLSVGSSIFELGGLCCCYDAYSKLNIEEEGYNNFFDINHDIIKKTYEFILDNYFENISEEDKTENRKKIELLTYTRMLHDLDPACPEQKDLYDDMYKKVQERLFTVDNLVLAVSK